MARQPRREVTNEDRLLRDSQEEVIGSLDHRFPCKTLGDISQAADAMEGWLDLFILKAIHKHSHIFFGLSSYGESEFLVDESNGHQYLLRVSVDSLDARLRVVSILDPIPTTFTESDHRFQEFESHGQVRRVTVAAPSTTQFRIEFVLNWLQRVHEVAYMWMIEVISRVISEKGLRVGAPLYAHIHKKLPEALIAQVWFACLIEGYGFRLLNEQVSSEAQSIIHKAAQHHVSGRGRLQAHFFSTRLGVRKLLMNEAASLGRAIDGELSRAGYTREGSIYAQTLEAFYGGTLFRIKPVALLDRVSVLALYPKECEVLVEPILHKESEELRRLSSMITVDLSRLKEWFVVSFRTRDDEVGEGDLIIAKPEVFGFGIDLNTAWRRVKKWMSDRSK